jgi:hypothetical protein
MRLAVADPRDINGLTTMIEVRAEHVERMTNCETRPRMARFCRI